MKKETKKYHPYANMYRKMSPEEKESLKKDIKENGLREPIWLYKDEIIDGRNRYECCIELGIKPKFQNYTGKDKDLLTFVLGLNNRKNISKGSRACSAVLQLEALQERTKLRLQEKKEQKKSGKAADEIGKIDTIGEAAELNAVSRRYVAYAQELFIKAIELFNEVMSENVTLTKAYTDYTNKIKQETSALMHKLDSEKQEVEHSNIVSVEPTSGTPEISHQEVNYKRTDLTKRELKKLQDYLEIGAIEQKAINKIVSQRRQVVIKDPDNEVKKTLKVILNESEKLKLDEICKRRNLTKTDLLKQFIKKLK